MTKTTTTIKELTISRTEVLLDSSQLDEELVRDCLKRSLILYLLRNSKLPIGKVMEDIFDLEIEVGNCVANVLSCPPEDKMASLRGVLANTLSVMPLGSRNKRLAVNPSTNSAHAGT